MSVSEQERRLQAFWKQVSQAIYCFSLVRLFLLRQNLAGLTSTHLCTTKVLSPPFSKTVVVLRGLPGSGKSTASAAAQRFLQEEGQRTIAICSADFYFFKPDGGLRLRLI